MSWQAYVDTSLVGTGDLDKAAIYNSEGTSVWATSEGFTISPEQMQKIVGAYKDPAGLYADGLWIADDKYIVFRADDRSIYGRKGKEGILIVKTKQAILLAHYPESVQPGNATKTVENLGDYLVKMDY